jgi:hypothetical protein
LEKEFLDAELDMGKLKIFTQLDVSKPIIKPKEGIDLRLAKGYVLEDIKCKNVNHAQFRY